MFAFQGRNRFEEAVSGVFTRGDMSEFQKEGEL